MMHLNRILSAILLLFIFTGSASQQTISIKSDTAKNNPANAAYKQVRFDLPMHIEPVLSGNFGELRSNHFHSGLDFKTNKRTGISVYAVADGWISRIRISAWGFGYALYLDHPNGFTSVYAHLDRYASPFDSIARAHQYHNRQSELDSLYKAGQFPVKKGQLIAYSGNSGSSSAPHMHFEIRDANTQEIIDPLLWYAPYIPDHKAPQIREIVVFAKDREGILKGDLKKKSVQVVRQKNGSWQLKDTLPAVWGKVSLGIKAFDLMDNTTNIYGICHLRLFEDDKELFSQEINRFSFDETRYINALIDYEAWIRNRSLIMTSFLLPGNKSTLCTADFSKGYINIDEEKTHQFRYVLSDRHGNTTDIRFILKGQRMQIPPALGQTQKMSYWQSNYYKKKDIALMLPPGTLYEDLDFRFNQKSSSHCSDIFYLHNSYTPIHSFFSLRLRLKVDTITEKKAYYLAKQDRYGKFQYVTSGNYSSGWLTANVREFGTYTIMADTVPPKITPLNIENTVKNRLFRIRVSDNATGIRSWKGTIDGQWVLFEYHTKSAQLRYVFDDDRLVRNRQHTLHLSVVDGCGNKSTFEHQFLY